MRSLSISLLSLCLFPALAMPQDGTEFWPGVRYDPKIPTFQKVLGYAPGQRITWHSGILKYFDALAAAAPTQIGLFDYGRTWEGRRLIYAAVGSEATTRRLDEIKASMQALADPRKTPEAGAKRLMASLPAVIWLGYGVHGNEISSPDAAMYTAYHLLAAKDDPVVKAILSSVLVLIDPQQNPDGRDRFVHNFEMAEGLEPDASPFAAEHNEPWPGGRTNHYYFDMNRDWYALTQPETQGRVKALREWYPLVFVDLHEMGADSTYYFAPEADPYNPHLTPEQKSNLEWFGKNNAKWFDKFGYDYFTRDVFDAFFPGYGASWPSYYGALAMTYEEASARGLLMRRQDDRIMTFRETVHRHHLASVSTAETAAQHREDLLRGFYDYRRTAIEEGKAGPTREYILPRRRDTAAVDKLAALLYEQGVELKRATAPFRNAGQEFPAGSYIIPLAQPSKRLIRTLLDPHVPMDEAFVKEQERRRKKKLPDEIYDVTGWSLPLSFNVECLGVGEESQGQFEPARPTRIPPGQVADSNPEVAFLVPWNTAGARLAAAALRTNLRILSADKSFTQNRREYPSGTLIFKIKDNPASLRETLQKLARESGAEVIPTSSSWVEKGVNFGSRYVVDLRKPAVAMAWDVPAASGSAGHTRFVLERQFGYPVTPVRTPQLASADLSRFQVLVFPAQGPGSYTETLGTRGIERLKSWVSSGGTLIGLGSAVAFLTDAKVSLLDLEQENTPASEPPKKKEEVEGRKPGQLLEKEDDYLKAIQPKAELPDRAPGVLLKAKLDPDHWITAGAGDSVYALVSGRAVYSPIALDKGVNAGLFAGPDDLVASGYLWAENRKQFAYKPLLVVQPRDRGVVVGFTADPNFRAYLDGMNLLFMNAVLRGPAHARPPATAEEWR